MATRCGISAAEADEWTPGMVIDWMYYRVNRQEEARQGPPPTQDMFDNF